MNDELDTLRTFRPEAAGPTDDLTLEGRNALMTAIDAEPLPRPTPRRRLLGRRRVRVAIVFAAALVAVGSVAAAAGLIPDDVRQSLGLASDFDPALTPKTDEAVQRATAANPDGGSVELWTAPTNGGGTCAYLRHLGAGGAPTESGAVACEVSLDGGRGMAGAAQVRGADAGAGAAVSGGGSVMLGIGAGDGLTMHMQWADGDPLSLYGQAPQGATAVAVSHADGTVTKVPVVDGWWLAVFAEGTDRASLTQLEATDAAGASLARAPLSSPEPGQGVVTDSLGG